MHRPTAPQPIRKGGGGAGRVRKSRLIDMSNERTFFSGHARFRDSITNRYIFPSYVGGYSKSVDLFKVSFYFVPW